jgi:hypothetical protein
MYQGWRDCFASNLWWVRFPPTPQNKKTKVHLIDELLERIKEFK